MSNGSSSPRFRIRMEDGSEIAVSSVEALARRVGRGDLLPDTPLYDSSVGDWRRAVDVAIVRFLLEEIVQETGIFPDGWSAESLSGQQPVEDRSEVEVPKRSFELSGFTIVDEAVAEGPIPGGAGRESRTEAEDFDFTLDPMAEEVLPAFDRPGEDLRASDAADSWIQRSIGEGLEEPFNSSSGATWGTPDSTPASVRAEHTRIRRGGDRGTKRRLLVLLSVSAAALAGLWIWSDQVGESVSHLVEAGRLQRPIRVINTSLPFIEIPAPAPVPAGLEGDVDQVVDGFRIRIAGSVGSLRRELEIIGPPPAAWLTGRYLANASQFPEVLAFWESYRILVEEMSLREETIFFDLLAAEVDRVELTDRNRARLLRDYLLDRWQRALPARDALFGTLALTAESAIELHEFLLLNQDALRFTPALGPQVPNDPVLEVEATSAEVDAELKARLDRVLMALDRSRTERISVMAGIEAALFSSIERF